MTFQNKSFKEEKTQGEKVFGYSSVNTGLIWMAI
jgi:hypothetical protein